MTTMNTLKADALTQSIKYLETWLDYNFANGAIPGMQVAVSYNREVVFSKAFGHADVETQEAMTTEYRFRIASHSKTFTATAIMQLIEADLIHIDDKVSKYLPWFSSEVDERVQNVTIQQLLNHTAGFIRDGVDSDFWQLLRDFPEEAELREYVRTGRLVYSANEKFKYSNYGYGVLGCVIAAVSGLSFEDYVNQRILKPLELTNTGVDVTAATESLATGYGADLNGRVRRPVGSKQISTGVLAPATGFYSTAEDLCSYFSGHFFGDTRLISDDSKRLMQHGAWTASDSGDTYGLGMIQANGQNWNLQGHSGGFPGFMTSTSFDPDKKVVVSVLASSYGVRPAAIVKTIFGMISTFQKEGAKDQASLEKYTGRFYAIMGAKDIVAAGGSLYLFDPGWWTGFHGADELTVVDDTTLKITKASGYSSLGELIHYTFDENGERSVKISGHSTFDYEGAVQQGWF